MKKNNTVNKVFFVITMIIFSLMFTACLTITTSSTARPQVVPTAINAGANMPPVANQPTIGIIQPTIGIVQPTPKPTINPNTPGEPPVYEGQVTDTDSSKFASEKRVVSGDSFKSNFYERPFTAQSMEYLPDVDIMNGFISSDANYFFFTIELNGVNKQTGTLLASYGVEMDTDKDGRGDYSVWALNPTSNSWTTDHVIVLQDRNHDVGGSDIYITDSLPTLSKGNGYETNIPNTGAEAAWVRVNPVQPNIVQIAVHRNLIGNPSEFLWGVWADNGPKNPNLFDYDDHFTYEEAGSPISGNQYYPLKKVAAIDNTCRRTYGFSASYRIPNMCWSGGAIIQCVNVKCSLGNCPSNCCYLIPGLVPVCLPY